MGTFITILGIIFFVVYLLAQDSKKETTKERYGEAVGQLAHMTADSISGFAHSITESNDSKQIRLAKEELAHRHGSLYRYDWYSNKDYIQSLLTVDEKLSNALYLLGLPEERWKKLALRFYYLGVIRKESRDSNDYTRKNTKHLRRSMIEEWPNEDKYLKDIADLIIEALSYFQIDANEWIEYGDTVIEMHELQEDSDMKEYGYIDSIMPMKNNLHQL